MAIDRAHLGRSYGPYRFTVGVEHLRDFVAATGMGVPGRVARQPPPGAHPWTWDEQAAAASPHGGLVAPPSFAAAFAIEPFSAACQDPALGIDLRRLVHGEQAFEHGAPVRPGDVLTTTGEITGIREKGPLDFLEVTTTSVNQRGETVVRGTWTAIVRGGWGVSALLAARRILGPAGR
jgi:acyl dehydratase